MYSDSGRGSAPCFVIAEIGLNHNGSLDIAKQLIDVAIDAGCDAVKFQKRDPELSTPAGRRDVMRDTPWGRMSYIDYRHRIEFGQVEFDEINAYCRGRIYWFASAWDLPSVEFLDRYDLPYIKIPSARITDLEFLEFCRYNAAADLIMSTGAADIVIIADAVRTVTVGRLACLMHCTSTYPCPIEELNLKAIVTLQKLYPNAGKALIGYSGHETGVPTTLAAVAMGAIMVERHITLDRSMWGSDQAASLEPAGLKRLVNYIRAFERAKGDGELKIFASERKAMERLRLVA